MSQNARSLFDQIRHEDTNREEIIYKLNFFDYSTSDHGRIEPRLTATQYLDEEANIYAVRGTFTYHKNSGQPINKYFKLVGVFLITKYESGDNFYDPIAEPQSGSGLHRVGQINMLKGLINLCETENINLSYTSPHPYHYNMRCCDVQIPNEIFSRNVNIVLNNEKHFIDARFRKVVSEDYIQNQKNNTDTDKQPFYQTTYFTIFEDISGPPLYEGIGYVLIDFSRELPVIATMAGQEYIAA